MELYIQTLTGTSYELRVSPFEPIISVKAKIQRLGGIPMSQQHLIWRSTELEDDFSLADYKVHNGATLRLVLAMRGGPINTRRIPIEDPAIKEMAEYMDSNKDEFGANRQLTLLVFREGDQLNFFRVMDRGDGTLTPLSESLSGTSVYNLNDDEDDDSGVMKEKKDENDRLKVKVNELRVKMEQLSLTKKLMSSQQASVHTPQPPSIRVPSNRPAAQHRFSMRGNNLPKVGNLNQKPLLPPLGKTFSTSNSKPSAVVPNPGLELDKSGMPGHPRLLANMNSSFGSGVSQVDSSVSAGKKLPPSESGGYSSRSGRITNAAKGPSHKALRFVTPEHPRDICAKHRNLDPLKTSERTHTCRDTATPRWELKPPTACSGIGRGVRQRASSTTPNVTDATNLLLLNHSKNNTSELMSSARLKFIPSSTCLSPTETPSSNRLHVDSSLESDPSCNPNTTTSPHPRPNSNSSNNINHNPSPKSNLYSNSHLSELISEHSHKGNILTKSTDLLDELALFSPVGQSTLISAEDLASQPSVDQHFCRASASGMVPADQNKEFLVGSSLPVNEHLPAVTGTFRQASFERLVPSHTGIFLNHGTKGSSVPKSGASSLSRNTQDLDEPTLSCQLQRVSTTHELLSPRLSSASSQRHLPPVKSMKKSSKRCLTCSKKTGLASSYQCRCGNNFCSAHRYAETHNCTFDYKAEGRKIIKQNNPVITASKLPKI